MTRMLLVVTVIRKERKAASKFLAIKGGETCNCSQDDRRLRRIRFPTHEGSWVALQIATLAVGGDGDRRQSTVEVKNSSAVLAFPKSNISAGIQKLVKSFKSLSQHVVVLYKEEDEEVEMEIGFPTDVQHVAHIGCDGFNSSMSGNKNWDRAPELLPFPSSMQQYELAVAAQAGAPPPYGPRATWPQ
ncbi:unnamed protein product [Musa acuminata subsp. burmannicoides]